MKNFLKNNNQLLTIKIYCNSLFKSQIDLKQRLKKSLNN